MKTNFLFSLLAILALTSCDEFRNTDNTDPDTTSRTSDTVVVVKDSLVYPKGDTTLGGFYSGMLPCNGCEGIQQTILFTNDDQFKQEEFNWGISKQPKKLQGRWDRKDGMIVLYSNKNTIGKYRMNRDSLIYTERNGTKISEEMSKRYVLLKRNVAISNQSWKKRQSEGIDFMGIGNEPFWNLEIDEEKLILFKVADWKKPVIVAIERPTVKKDSTVYSVIAEGAPLRITISTQFCSDGMSDNLYEYKLVVYYLGQTYKGCGVYLNPARENDSE